MSGFGISKTFLNYIQTEVLSLKFVSSKLYEVIIVLNIVKN